VFRNLYICAYDSPEAYAIEKDGRTYFAFFTDKPQSHAARIELRGICTGPAVMSWIPRTREITVRSMARNRIWKLVFENISRST